MACLNLSNGNFGGLAWQTGNFNSGNVTINRTAGAISITRTGLAPLNMNGDFRWVVFGASQFIAILAIDSGGTTRTVFIVDATGGTLTLEQVHQQVGVSSAVAQPSIASSPGSASLFFVFSSTGTVSEVNALAIVRSDDGTVVLNRLGPISGLTIVPFAEITSTQLIIHHNSTFTTTTSGPRPAGSLDITGPNSPFAQAVIGASNPALASVTRSFTLENDDDDCIDVTGIADRQGTTSPANARYSS